MKEISFGTKKYYSKINILLAIHKAKMVYGRNNTSLLDYISFLLSVICFMHEYKKYLAIAGVGAAVAAVGLALFAKTRMEEKHGFWH